MNNFFSINQLKKMGIKIFGDNIKVSKLSRIYNPNNLTLHNNIRIDDFTILSGKGKINIGNYVHIGPQCFISSYTNIDFDDYTGLSSGVKLFGSSDDYSGKFMTNPTIPSEFLGTITGNINLEKHVIIGANSIVLPNITIKEGTAVGSLSLINKTTEAWKIYAGNPGKIIKDRNKNLLKLEKEFSLKF